MTNAIRVLTLLALALTGCVGSDDLALASTQDADTELSNSHSGMGATHRVDCHMVRTPFAFDYQIAYFHDGSRLVTCSLRNLAQVGSAYSRTHYWLADEGASKVDLCFTDPNLFEGLPGYWRFERKGTEHIVRYIGGVKDDISFVFDPTQDCDD